MNLAQLRRWPSRGDAQQRDLTLSSRRAASHTVTPRPNPPVLPHIRSSSLAAAAAARRPPAIRRLEVRRSHCLEVRQSPPLPPPGGHLAAAASPTAWRSAARTAWRSAAPAACTAWRSAAPAAWSSPRRRRRLSSRLSQSLQQHCIVTTVDVPLVLSPPVCGLCLSTAILWESSMSLREGDWNCRQCGNVNFSFINAFNHGACSAPRPSLSPSPRDPNLQTPPMPLPAVSPTQSLPSDDHRLASLLYPGMPLSHRLQLLAFALRLGHHLSPPLLSVRFLSGLPHRHILHLLHLLPPVSVLPFNSALRALVDAALPSASFATFRAILRAPLRPNSLTFSFLLKVALASKNRPFMVRQVHVVVAKSPFVRDPSVLNGLVLAYGKGIVDVESVRDARKVFDEMPDRRLACSWSCLISAYARRGLVDDALGLFFRMVGEGVRPEDDTMVGVVSACAKVHGADIERWVNIVCELRGRPFDRIFVNAVDTVLVYLYGKLGNVEEGRAMFDEMVGNTRGGLSIVSWNCMIGAYVQNDQPVEALRVFHHMCDLGDPQPNHVTIVNLLSACAFIGDLELGRWAYEYMTTKRRQGVIESNRILATAFIDMFSKCGSLQEAQKVFEGVRDKDIVSFNAMIMGFATNGQEEKALMLFYEMEKHRVKPNEGTFLAILCACTHSGLVDEGRRFFRNMSAKYYIMPNIEHYTCYIDLLARAGHIAEALDVVKTMCISPNAIVWGALLGACLVHSKVDIAQNVADKLVSVDPGSSAGYVLLSNAYAFDHTWPATEEMRGLMKVRGVRKLPGMSWINIGGSLYEFQVGSSSCPQFSDMCFVLNSLSQEMRSMSS